jgi:hypothetical protein
MRSVEVARREGEGSPRSRDSGRWCEFEAERVATLERTHWNRKQAEVQVNISYSS